MAGEIVELRRHVIGKHSKGDMIGESILSFDVLFLYPVVPPVVINGTQFPLTPRGGLPAHVETYQLITSEELAALDSGDLVFHLVIGVEQKNGETLLQLLQRVRRIYEKRGCFVAEAQAMYVNAGGRYNA